MPDHHDHLESFLSTFADSLIEDSAETSGSTLIHVAAHADGFEVGVLPLDDRPADVLLGTVVPEHWLALGAAGGGRVHSLDGSPAPPGRPPRATSVVIVTRSGVVISRMRLGETVTHEPPAYGLTLDGLQRALGLPTAPPLVTTTELFAVMWLEFVIAEVEAARPRRLSWEEASNRHPALQLLSTDDYDVSARPSDLVDAARVLGRVCDWDRLRWLVVEELWSDGHITPTDAAWLDAGSFSRWVMLPHPPLARLLDDLRRMGEPRLARRCAAVVHQLGLRRASAA